MAGLLLTFQDAAAGVLGLAPERRAPLVRAMLYRPRGDAAGYWLQLLIATALATLGLALSSGAVVIGAMLIAPLMRPIVELAMGLATGSIPLVARAGVRAVASVLAAVIASTIFTWLIPFHEVTAELLARTAPSLLDLFIAAACALAGAYAVVSASNDVATTAAGTSIGISLVPPLCTVGYGISTADWDMATGAALLFTANVTAIVIFASALFAMVGFGRVETREAEAGIEGERQLGRAERIGRVLESRSRRLAISMRLGLPLLLLAAIAYPLTRAVHEMTRRSDIRQRVAALLHQAGPGEHVVQYTLDQTARPMSLRVVVVGDAAVARQLEDRLRAELVVLDEAKANVAVWAVPDARAVSELAARLDDVPQAVPALSVAPAPPPPVPALAVRLRAAWPAKTGGALVGVWVRDSPPTRARLVHLGAPIGAPALEAIAQAVRREDEPAVPLDELALDSVVAAPGELAAWLPAAGALLAHADEVPGLTMCVTMPPPPKPRAARASPLELYARELVRRAGSSAVTVAEGPEWAVRPTTGPCPAAVSLP